MSRRDLFKDVGAAGAATLLSVRPGNAKVAQSAAQQSEIEQILSLPSKTLLQQHEDASVELTAGEIVVTFDKRYGSISSLTRKGDELGTNYIGNETNAPGVDPPDSRWTGDVVSTVWELLGDWKAFNLGQNDIFKMSGKWKRELTGKSADIHRVGFQNNTFVVKYDGQSASDEGLRSYRLTMTYHAGEDNSLIWDIEIENVTNNVLEIGELGLPLMVNDDYAELYSQAGLQPALSSINNVDFARTPLR
jgi:hypothetical protein